MNKFRSQYQAGDVVEVRTREEILATLGKDGTLENLPFMPEMLQFCGQRFEVFASAHKTCDTIHKTGCRRMRRTIHLDGLRCDGSAHGGCQTSCLLFWKEDWVKATDSDRYAKAESRSNSQIESEQSLIGTTRKPNDDPRDPTYVCQATKLFEATEPMKSWSLRQYIADVTSKNFKLGEAAKILILGLIYNLRLSGHGYRFAVRIYDSAHRLLRGGPSPYGRGAIPQGEKTPLEVLDLKVGEVVLVKSHEEILATLNVRGQNRGMLYDKEMVRYCGEKFRVIACVTKLVDERTGKLVNMASPSVILDGTYCTSQYSERRLMCPRQITPFWRENWLHRVGSATDSGSQDRQERSDG